MPPAASPSLTFREREDLAISSRFDLSIILALGLTKDRLMTKGPELKYLRVMLLSSCCSPVPACVPGPDRSLRALGIAWDWFMNDAMIMGLEAWTDESPSVADLVLLAFSEFLCLFSKVNLLLAPCGLVPCIGYKFETCLLWFYGLVEFC